METYEFKMLNELAEQAYCLLPCLSLDVSCFMVLAYHVFHLQLLIHSKFIQFILQSGCWGEYLGL